MYISMIAELRRVTCHVKSPATWHRWTRYAL